MQASDFQLMPLFVFLLISLFDRNTVKISFPVKIFLLHNAEKMEPVIQNSQNTHKRSFLKFLRMLQNLHSQEK